MNLLLRGSLPPRFHSYQMTMIHSDGISVAFDEWDEESQDDKCYGVLENDIVDGSMLPLLWLFDYQCEIIQ